MIKIKPNERTNK